MKYRPLGKTGFDVSVLSFGASSLGSVFREINQDEGIRTVHTAVEQGINLIDVSPYYGLTKAETVLGKALKEIPRDKYMLSTKAGRYGENEFDYSYERIIHSAEESMQRLNVDYLDVLLLHDFEFVNREQVLEEGIPALRHLKEQGKVRFIGISALPIPAFKKVIDHTEDLDVILSYCHYSMNDTALLDIISYLNSKQIGIISASPLSMGLLSNRSIADWHPADDEIKQICKQATKFCADQGEDIAKLAIQFSVSNDKIPTTLVSTASVNNMVKNIQWTDEEVDEELMQEVLNILKPIKNKTWTSGRQEYWV